MHVPPELFKESTFEGPNRLSSQKCVLQGTLLFVGLLILLWVPLLVFSSGNPTYQVRRLT